MIGAIPRTVKFLLVLTLRNVISVFKIGPSSAKDLSTIHVHSRIDRYNFLFINNPVV